MAEYIVNVQELIAQYEAGQLTAAKLVELIDAETIFVRRVLLRQAPTPAPTA